MFTRNKMFVYQSVFYFIVILGQRLSITASRWLLVWLMIEISLLTIIPLMVGRSKSLSLSFEVTMKYFIVQRIRSIWIILGGYKVWEINTGPCIFSLVFFVGLIFKLGLFPGHFWVIQVVSGLKKLPLLFILSVTKAAPLSLVVRINFSTNLESLLFVGAISIVSGGLLGTIQTTVRGVLARSSIAHSGWIIISIVSNTFLPYFLAYFISISAFLILCGTVRYLSSIMMLSFSGLPPFLLFYPKVIVFSVLVESSIWVVIGCLVIIRVISLYFYLKRSYSLGLMRTLSYLLC